MKKRPTNLLLFLLLIIVGVGLYFAIQKAQVPAESPSAEVKPGERQLKDLECLNNLKQVRHAIAAYMADHNNALPHSLNDLSQYGIKPENLRCPVGGEPYIYNEGTVTCPHPEHEKF